MITSITTTNTDNLSKKPHFNRLKFLFQKKRGIYWKKQSFKRIIREARRLSFYKRKKKTLLTYISIHSLEATLSRRKRVDSLKWKSKHKFKRKFKRKFKLTKLTTQKLLSSLIKLNKTKVRTFDKFKRKFKPIKLNTQVPVSGIIKWNKTKVSTYDKLFYYYTVKTPMSLYAHKAFILLEMQLNASLVRMKLVPYLFLSHELCFYRIVRLNNEIINSPYHILSVYDTVSIPVALHNYMYYRQYRVQHYPRQLANFFKHYWMQFTNYNQNKVWLLTNFLLSNITAEAMIFDYPNIISYMSPFRRFTFLYYRNQPYTEPGTNTSMAYTHTIIKLKLFTYAAFYK